MNIYELSIRVPVPPAGLSALIYFSEQLEKRLPQGAVPVRFAVVRTADDYCDVEVGVLEGLSPSLAFPSIFNFLRRPFDNTERFNAVMVVPTGIGALVGGHAGDAGPTSRLLASVCDSLIVHPNIVNASDINEMTENTLYAEGSVISRLLMGQIGLRKVRSSRVLAVVEDHPTDELFVNGAINAVNAARAAGALDCQEVLVLKDAMRLIAEYSSSGTAVGRVENLGGLLAALASRRDRYDSIAISSIIKIPSRRLHAQYFESKGDMINPWGGVEAIFTHAVSTLLNVQSAHSPMIEDQLVSNMDVGIVDARQAAEAVSFTYMHCILKGLQRAPQIVTDPAAMTHHSVLTARDVSCLVIPDGCVGIPTMAALEQGIPVIAVRGNTNLMRNDLSRLPWGDEQLHVVGNYLEAVGVMAALKSGTSISTLRRPMSNASIISSEDTQERDHSGGSTKSSLRNTNSSRRMG